MAQVLDEVYARGDRLMLRFLLAHLALAFAQAATQRRFVFIIQRGAADGLNTVIPYAEPAYGSLRGALAIDPAAGPMTERKYR